MSVFLPNFTGDPMIIFQFFYRKLPTIRRSNFGFFAVRYRRSDDHISVFFAISCRGSRHFWYLISWAGFCFSWFNAIIFCGILAIQPVDYDDVFAHRRSDDPTIFAHRRSDDTFMDFIYRSTDDHSTMFYRRSDDHKQVFLLKFTDDPTIKIWFCLPMIR